MRESERSDSSPPARLRPSGGYRRLRSFQVATLIYDATVSFCDRFIDKRSRTHDQMVQAARSGRQNIAEGSRAGATSSQTELRLTNVARASLDELLLDYEDFLRQHALRQWGKDDPESQAVCALGRQSHQSDRSDPSDSSTFLPPEHQLAYAPWLAHPDPAIVANAIICLIHQANYLLDQQLAHLERAFVQHGGYSEQLAAARLAQRQEKRSDQSDRSDRSDSPPTTPPTPPPACPICGLPMILRTARAGPVPGSRFWGCTSFPNCKGKLKFIV